MALVEQLVVQDLSLVKNGRQILSKISFAADQASCTCVLGPNGAGKTSLIKSLNGLENFSSTAPITQPFKKQSLVFQTPVLLNRTVLENIVFALRINGISKTLARQEAMSRVQELGITGLLNRKPWQLSAGERQLVCIVRGLITQPNLLMLDEPCSNLDGSSTRKIEAVLKQATQNGVTILIITHDLAQAKRLADNVLFIHEGKVQDFLPSKAFFSGQCSALASAFQSGEII